MRVHWFAFTYFASHAEFDALYQEVFAPIFGDYVPKDHGGRGYRTIAETSVGMRLYFDPVSIGERGNHIHVEIPGQACDCILPDKFRDLMAYFIYGLRKDGQPQTDRFSVKRLDLAFDHEFFTPEDWFDAISSDSVITLAKRDQIRVDQSPFALRDDGQKGTMTVYLGSNESGRMVRVYNKRGPTRLELQMRDDRAHLVAIDVLLRHPSKWHEAALAHIIQYVTFKDGQAPVWWLEFTGSVQSADLKISSSRVVSWNKVDGWLKRQVSAALSVAYDVMGGEYVRDLLDHGKERNRSRYAPILQLA